MPVFLKVKPHGEKQTEIQEGTAEKTRPPLVTAVHIESQRPKANYFRLTFIIILAFCATATWFVSQSICCIDLDLNKAFNSKFILNTNVIGGMGAAFTLYGVDGSKLKMGFPASFANVGPPEVRTNAVPILPAEELVMTPKNLDEIKDSLSDLELEKWADLSKLPSSIFQFHLDLQSDPTSLNGLKQHSYFLISFVNSVTNKLLPGRSMRLVEHLNIKKLSDVLSSLTIKLVYDENAFPAQIFDKNDKFVSQATGKLKLRPNWQLNSALFLAIWTLMIGVLTLLKETLQMGKELKKACSTES